MKNKFSFLGLDDDNFVETISKSKKKEDIEMEEAKKESERIEKLVKENKEKKKIQEEIERKELERILQLEKEKIKKLEKEAKKISENHELKKQAKIDLLKYDEKLEKMENVAKKMKVDYQFQKKMNLYQDEINNDVNIEKIENNDFNKIFQKNEKLDVKTNIYLKKDLYKKITEMYKKTGVSRSAIINKLLEIALKETLK